MDDTNQPALNKFNAILIDDLKKQAICEKKRKWQRGCIFQLGNNNKASEYNLLFDIFGIEMSKFNCKIQYN